MKQFIAKFADKVDGILSGFDRLVMRGELRALYIANGGGIEQYLRSSHVMFKDFGAQVLEVSRRLKEASLGAALELDRVVRYVPSAAASKEDIARQIASEQKIQSGLVCVLNSVEPCMSFQAVPNGETQKLDFKLEQRKCLHLYHYLIHPVFGFMNARIQTWFPFRIQICLNGREWLARQMDAAGLRYVRQDNCFPWIEDFAEAQRLMGQQLSTNWAEALHGIAVMLNPIHEEIFQHFQVNYYWTTHQSLARIEATVNNVSPFRSYRPKEGGPNGELAWRPMRRGIADLHRRTEVSQKMVERYADGLASVDDSRRLEELTKNLERSTTWNGRPVRGLRLLGEDNELLLAVSRGEFNLNGFRNRDLQRLIKDGKPADSAEGKRRCAAMSRKLRMLRAHGLIKKVPHTHRYLLTDFGRVAITAISAAQHATVAQLSRAA